MALEPPGIRRILAGMTYPRSPRETVGGIVYFGRLVDKIRLNAEGQLHPELHQNLGIGFDKRCTAFLYVDYEKLAEQVRAGLSDEQALEWSFANGRKPSDEEIEIWNGFMVKRGWNDAGSEMVAQRKKESGLENRDDIQTMFDYIDADEGRS